MWNYVVIAACLILIVHRLQEENEHEKKGNVIPFHNKKGF